MTTQFINTIDLDKIDKQQLEMIIQKIKMQPCCLDIKTKDSFSKGYHILLICSKKCSTCRMVFDDQKRFEMDNSRDIKFQNTLFTEKEYIMGNPKHIRNWCDHCFKYSKVSIMQKKILTKEETKQKIRKGKINFPLSIVFISYDYYECPKCGWFKFVRIGVKI